MSGSVRGGTAHLLAPRLWHVEPLEVADMRLVICFSAGFANDHVMYDSNLHGPQARRPASTTLKPAGPNDSELLRRMLFGSAPMAVVADSTKLHEMADGKQFMVSRLWPDELIEPLLQGTTTPRRSSQAAVTPIAATPPKVVKRPSSSQLKQRTSSQRRSTEGSEFDFASVPRGVDSPLSPPSRRSPSVSSRGSSADVRSNLSHRSRRLNRSVRANMEFGITHSLSSSSVSGSRRACVWGVALVVNLEKNSIFKRFLLTHFVLVEHLLARFQEDLTDIARALAMQMQPGPGSTASTGRRRLPIAALAARLQRSTRCTRLVDALRTALVHLYSQPRIQEPVWLNLSTYSRVRHIARSTFVDVFTALLGALRAAGCASLLSRALTAVLSLHLGWVGTVTPTSDALADQLTKCTPLSAHRQASAHPYDPLWAQLTDLYGTCSSPPRISRTIVVGQDPERVRQFLFIITYFLRCSEVFELNVAPQGHALVTEQQLQQGDGGGGDSGGGGDGEDMDVGEDGVLGEEAHATTTTTDSSRHGNSSSNSNNSSGCGGAQLKSGQESACNGSSVTGSEPRAKDMTQVDLRSSECVRVFPDLSSTAVSSRLQAMSHAALRASPDKEHLFTRSLGRSLQLTYTHTFVTGAVLQGLPRPNFMPSLEQELRSFVRFGIFGEPVSVASCAIINTDTNDVEVVTVRPDACVQHWPIGLSSSSLFPPSYSDQFVPPTPAPPLAPSTPRSTPPSTTAPATTCAVPSPTSLGVATDAAGGGATLARTGTVASRTRVQASPLVASMIDAFEAVVDTGLPHALCLEHIEDHLTMIHTQSQLFSAQLAAIEANSATHSPASPSPPSPPSPPPPPSRLPSEEDVSALMGISPPDAPLLLAVAGTFDPRAHTRVRLSRDFDW